MQLADYFYITAIITFALLTSGALLVLWNLLRMWYKLHHIYQQAVHWQTQVAEHLPTLPTKQRKEATIAKPTESDKPSGNPLTRLQQAADTYQRKHTWLGFPYAVVKKYGDDEASYQGALITYYGFLSLFPLLIVTTSTLRLLMNNNASLRDSILDGVNRYIPVIGSDLQDQIHTSGKAGIALVIATLISLYGARGAADAIRHAFDHIWHVPRVRRAGFPKNILRSLSMIVVGGLGLLASAFLSGLAANLTNYGILRIVPALVSLVLLIPILAFVFKIGTSSPLTKRDVLVAATIAAVGVSLLQVFGIRLITHQMASLDQSYGTFAIALALMFWIYLQAQVILYAVEISTVFRLKLWPRSLTGNDLTAGDQRAYRLHAEKEQQQEHQKIRVDF